MAPESIERGAQLLVEGKDERNFFEGFIEHLQLPDIQIQVLEGRDRLRDSLETLAGATAFRNVRSIGIVRDADESAGAAFQSVQTSLRNANRTVTAWSSVDFPVPDRPEERTGDGLSLNVLILPGDGDDGMLETLLCKTIAGTAVDRCIDGFFRCAGESGSRIHRPDKARARAYLATTPDPHLSVGVAAKRDRWNLDHEAFDHVRRFLKSLVLDQRAA